MTAPDLLPSSRRRTPPSSGHSPPTAQVEGRGMVEPGAWSGASLAARHSGPGRWLVLLHWISADAVLVVLAYAWAMARRTGISLPWPVYAFLALGVWLGYTADRLADLERIPSRAQRTGRHAFHLRHRRVLTTVWVGGFLAAWPLAWILLPSRAVLAGGGLAAAAAFYVWWGSGASDPSKCRRRGDERRKRPFTAILLTSAGVWCLWAGGGGLGPPVGVLAGIFAVAAWWNLSLLRYHRGSPSRELDSGFERRPGQGRGRRLVRGPERGRARGHLRGLPRGSILAAGLLLALPLWSGVFLLLPAAALMVLGLGGLAWRGGDLRDDVLALAADGTLCVGLLAAGLAVG